MFIIHTYRGNEIIRSTSFKADMYTALMIYDAVEDLTDLTELSVMMVEIVSLSPYKEKFICSTELIRHD